ncbi:nucleoid-associated protein [Bacteroides graminisolvens]
MIDFIKCNIDSLSIHKVGNKYEEELIQFSNQGVNLENPLIRELLVKYFLYPFKSNEYYNFHHSIDINLNEVFVCVNKIFENNKILHEQSINLAKHLYEQSTHPKIKGGEFYTVYFRDCIIDEKTVDVIGLFKSENRDTFLKVFSAGESFAIESQQGININKLDKGCLIFNTEQKNGYIVAVVDNTNKGSEAQYWLDNFLHICPCKDEYHKTQNLLFLCKNFVKNELPQHFEISKADQADMLNKSVKFLKENDSFNMKDFTNKVIGQPTIIESFNQYKSSFQKEYDIEIGDNFTISESAIKKQARSLKSIIKLDNNFDILIHSSRNLIEQGVDEKGKYYKVYYQEES